MAQTCGRSTREAHAAVHELVNWHGLSDDLLAIMFEWTPAVLLLRCAAVSRLPHLAHGCKAPQLFKQRLCTVLVRNATKPQRSTGHMRLSQLNQSARQ